MHTEKKGFWERNWMWALPCGCLGCLGLTIGACVTLVGTTIGLVRSSDVFEDALERARQDPRIIAELGEPIDAGWQVQGNFNLSDDSSEASYSIPLSGPDGDATLTVEATKHDEEWVFHRLEVRFDSSGDRIDLLEPGG